MLPARSVYDVDGDQIMVPAPSAPKPPPLAVPSVTVMVAPVCDIVDAVPVSPNVMLDNTT